MSPASERSRSRGPLLIRLAATALILLVLAAVQAVMSHAETRARVGAYQLAVADDAGAVLITAHLQLDTGPLQLAWGPWWSPVAWSSPHPTVRGPWQLTPAGDACLAQTRRPYFLSGSSQALVAQSLDATQLVLALRPLQETHPLLLICARSGSGWAGVLSEGVGAQRRRLGVAVLLPEP